MTGRSVTRWWWVRHAPVREAGGRVTGQLDLEADCGDHDAIARVAVRLPQNPVWMASPLRRARQTLDVLHTACGIAGASVAVERDMAEQDFGDWQGKTYAELEESDADRYKKFWIAPGLRPGRREDLSRGVSDARLRGRRDGLERGGSGARDCRQPARAGKNRADDHRHAPWPPGADSRGTAL
jgi:broad specificity phosphatase PhoE